MRFAELFAGAGGLSMGLERAGWSCAWHAELAEHPRAVLSQRWPDVPLYGDVTTLDGRALIEAHGPIDLLTGGSPCQDLSIAGKRAGLSGGRSSLFFQQMRLWDETGADLCLWENVDGARSSNEGKDFGEVLRAFVGAAFPVPSDGWRSAGVVAGPAGVAAWRILDAQFFGVPQRRRRVFVLGTRTGRVDPAEVLSLAEGVRGDSPTRREAGQVAPTLPASGAGTARTGNSRTESGLVVFDWQNSPSQGMECRSESDDSLRTKSVPAVLAFNAKQDGGDADTVAPSLLAMPHDESHPNGGGQLAVCLTGDVTHALTHEGHDASEDGTGRGTPVVVGTLSTRTCRSIGAQDAAGGHIVAGALMSFRRGVPSSDECAQHHVVPSAGIPRRLTPRECERLMGWPDDHTLVSYRGKLMSDASRYKMCGNGVASPVTHWIGWRLALCLGGAYA
jgi:DNA (cytosine-5)-methyltransferase 1